MRLRASRKAALFSLNSREPIPSLDGVLVTITAVVRGQPGKTIVLALRDVTDAAGNAETVADRQEDLRGMDDAVSSPPQAPITPTPGGRGWMMNSDRF